MINSTVPAKKAIVIFLLLILSAVPGWAEDSEISRSSLAGLQGVCVIIEDLQPNIKDYAVKYGLTKAEIQKEIEQKIRTSGIGVLNNQDWLNMPGRPVLYININTHPSETKSLISKLLSDHREEKALLAFDIKVELRQVAYLEANPKVKTLAITWSVNMTGLVNVENLTPLKSNVLALVEHFIDAYKSVNVK